MTRHRILYEIAEDQFGYFTTKDATQAGVKKPDLTKMVAAGHVGRVAWGVYRLTNFPPSTLDQYMEATLWPRSVRGVLSHETALELHGLTDVSPEKIHLTVPRSYRIRRTVPLQYVLHKADLLPDSEIGKHEGIPITTPYRAIRECHEARLGPALLSQALDEGRKRGVLSEAQARSLAEEIFSTT